MSEYISLLWPAERQKYKDNIRRLNDEVINDLSIEYLCNKIASGKDQVSWIKDILCTIVSSEEVIKYRQNIFEDIYSNSELNQKLVEILEELKFLFEVNSKKNKYNEEPSIFRVITRVRELDAYSNTIHGIDDCLSRIDYKSEGLKKLHKLVKEIISDPLFFSLREDNKRMVYEVNKIKSLTFGMNLNNLLEPTEVTLLSINDVKFKETKSFVNSLLNISQNIKSRSSQNEIARNINYDSFFNNKMKRMSLDRAEPVIYHFTSDIQEMLKPTYKEMINLLNKYTEINSAMLIGIIPEIEFYLSISKMLKQIEKQGVAITKPELNDKETRRLYAKDFYNIKLALHMIEEKTDLRQNMILNSIELNENGRVVILTGANRGGKTTYTQAIGLMQLLCQIGVFVPASKFETSLVDTIFTHFPADENRTIELGRFGEEAKRLGDIFASATKYSLILLNESLATTNHSEAIYIAGDILRGFRLLGSKVIFNTHMHELGKMIHEINNEIDGESKIISYISKTINGERK